MRGMTLKAQSRTAYSSAVHEKSRNLTSTITVDAEYKNAGNEDTGR
jgi:hypothetical protein